jgi:RsiW-degrading membrane proteinase PrsW (M82 family)
VIHLAIALLPVAVFLAALVLMDSFKLVTPPALAGAVTAGVLAFFACDVLHDWLFLQTHLDVQTFSRYVAPLTEESFKAILVVFLVWRGRIGFLVDAAIVGFAIGTGFAVAENLDYLRTAPGSTTALWVARGFGTAMLHGATTSIFAILARHAADRRPGASARPFVPALATVIAIHSVFNHFLLPPVVTAAVLTLALPAMVEVVFSRSERATREWMGDGLDLDVEVLKLLLSREFASTRAGLYLKQLRERFPGPVVADMFCLLRVRIELGIRAKGMLLAREAGVEVPADDNLIAQLEELDYLRRAIGRTGLMALRPLQGPGDRDRWQATVLAQAARRRRPKT